MCSVFWRQWIVFQQESGRETVLQSEGFLLLEALVNRKFPTTSLAQRQASMCVCRCNKQGTVDGSNVMLNSIFFHFEKGVSFQRHPDKLACLSRQNP